MQARWRSGTERRCCDRLSVPREIHPGVEECGPVNPSNLPLDRNPLRDRTQIVNTKGPSPCVYQIKICGYAHSYLTGFDTTWQYYERTIIMHQNGDTEWELLHEDYYWGERR